MSEYKFRSLSKALKQICSVFISEVHHNSAKRLEKQDYFAFLRLCCFVVVELNPVEIKNKIKNVAPDAAVITHMLNFKYRSSLWKT